MGNPNCTFYDEAIPYDAHIPYDGICFQPQPTAVPFYYIGRRSKEEYEKDRRRRLGLVVKSEVFSVNGFVVNGEENEIRWVSEDAPMEVGVTGVKVKTEEVDYKVEAKSSGGSVIPSVSAEADGVLPEVKIEVLSNNEEEDVVEYEDNDSISVEAESVSSNGNIQLLCELVTNTSEEVIIKVEATEQINDTTVVTAEPKKTKDGV